LQSQPVFALSPQCLAEKQQIPILVFGLTQSTLDPMIYRTRGEHANHYTTDAVIQLTINNDKAKTGWLCNHDNVSKWSDMSTRGLLFQ
jgi:hypothetical protein